MVTGMITVIILDGGTKTMAITTMAITMGGERKTNMAGATAGTKT